MTLEEALESTKQFYTFMLNTSNVSKKGDVNDDDFLPMAAIFIDA